MNRKKQLVIELGHALDRTGFFVYLEFVFCGILYSRMTPGFVDVPIVRFGEIEKGLKGTMKNPYFDASIGDNMFDYYFYLKQKLEDGVSVDEVRESPGFWRKLYNGICPQTYPRGKDSKLNRLFRTPYTKEIDDWYKPNRLKASKIIDEHVAIRDEILNEVDEMWNEFFAEDDFVLGIHLRGTDKRFGGRKIPPKEHFPYIDYFIKHMNAKIFLATDDPAYLIILKKTYGDRVFFADCHRHVKNSFLVDEGSPYHKGLEVLKDVLLLSRCNFLLKSTSAVSEFAIYFNQDLHENSLNLQYDCSYFLSTGDLYLHHYNSD